MVTVSVGIGSTCIRYGSVPWMQSSAAKTSSPFKVANEDGENKSIDPLLPGQISKQ